MLLAFFLFFVFVVCALFFSLSQPRMLIGAAAIYGLFSLAKWYFTRDARELQRRYAEDRCLNCGYDLRASPGRCPDCGSFI